MIGFISRFRLFLSYIFQIYSQTKIIQNIDLFLICPLNRQLIRQLSRKFLFERLNDKINMISVVLEDLFELK